MKDIKSGARSNGNTAAMKGVMHLVKRGRDEGDLATRSLAASSPEAGRNSEKKETPECENLKSGWRCAPSILATSVAAGCRPSRQAPKAEGHRVRGLRVWNEMIGEKMEALELTGDVENGEEAYEICSACHLPSGAGRPDGTFPQLAGQHTDRAHQADRGHPRRAAATTPSCTPSRRP